MKSKILSTLCCLVAIMACGTALAQNRQPLRAPAYKGPITPMRPLDLPEAAPFYSNFSAIANTCTTCTFNSSIGFLVLGPTNCFSPGATQWLAYPFLAGHTGPLRQATLAVTQFGACGGGIQFNAAIYDDACPSTGAPNTLLTSANANAVAAPCLTTRVRFPAGTTLTAGNVYWLVVTTTSPAQDTFTGVWWFANSGPEDVNFNDGSGWLLFGGAGAFAVQ